MFKEWLIHSTSWEFVVHIVYISRTTKNFFIKFWNSYPNFDSNILLLLYLKLESSANKQIAIFRCYIPITNFLSCHKVKTYTGEPFDKKVGQWFGKVGHVFWSCKYILIFIMQICSALVEFILFDANNGEDSFLWLQSFKICAEILV